MRGFINFAAPAPCLLSSFFRRETEETFFIARTFYFYLLFSSVTYPVQPAESDLPAG
jgi:hypothetical protein